jgi:hypothetical protein
MERTVHSTPPKERPSSPGLQRKNALFLFVILTLSFSKGKDLCVFLTVGENLKL